MTKNEKMFLCEMMGRLLNCYDENGNTVPDYYENIILPDISARELEVLKKIASYDI
jgi:hypothetical protein